MLPKYRVGVVIWLLSRTCSSRMEEFPFIRGIVRLKVRFLRILSLFVTGSLRADCCGRLCQQSAGCFVAVSERFCSPAIQGSCLFERRLWPGFLCLLFPCVTAWQTELLGWEPSLPTAPQESRVPPKYPQESGGAGQHVQAATDGGFRTRGGKLKIGLAHAGPEQCGLGSQGY